MFTLREHHEIDLAKAGEGYSVEKKDFTRPQKGEILILEHKGSNEIMMICNAQLYPHIVRDYIKEAQALYLLERACKINYDFVMAR